jgi:hypothetical protein
MVGEQRDVLEVAVVSAGYGEVGAAATWCGAARDAAEGHRARPPP